MKKSIATFIAVIVSVAALHAFRLYQQSTITGRIVPVKGANVIWAINGKDSIKTIPSAEDGNFAFTVKPGGWDIRVEALPPYKNITLKLTVVEGKNNLLGEIKLPR